MAESDVTLGELGRRLDGIASDISSFRAEAVLRGEYEAHRTAIDREIRDIKAEIAAMKDKETKSRQPWTATVSTVVQAAGFVITILLLIVVVK